MMVVMKRRLLAATVATSLLVCSSAFAQNPAEDKESGPPDPRYVGYAGGIPVTLPESSTAGSWAILAVLGLLGVGVMFKSGNRTHLD